MCSWLAGVGAARVAAAVATAVERKQAEGRRGREGKKEGKRVRLALVSLSAMGKPLSLLLFLLFSCSALC